MIESLLKFGGVVFSSRAEVSFISHLFKRLLFVSFSVLIYRLAQKPLLISSGQSGSFTAIKNLDCTFFSSLHVLTPLCSDSSLSQKTTIEKTSYNHFIPRDSGPPSTAAVRISDSFSVSAPHDTNWPITVFAAAVECLFAKETKKPLSLRVA